MTRRTISLRQLTWIQVMAILPTTLVFLPGQMFHQDGAGAWYLVGCTVAGAWLLNRLVTRMSQGLSADRLFRATFGASAGRVLSGIYALGLTIALVSIWNELFTFVTASVLPRTPEWAVGLLSTVVVLALADGGMSGLARVTDILAVGTISFGVLILIPTIEYVRWTHYVPELTAPQWSWLTGALLPLSFLGESIIGIQYADAARDRNPVARAQAITRGALISGLVFWIVITVLWGVLGAGYAGSLNFPILEAIRDVRMGQFLSRLDLVFVPIWLGLINLKLALWIYAGVKSWRQAAAWGSERLWLLTVSVSTVSAAVLGFPTLAERIRFLEATWTDSLFPLLTLLVLLSGGWRRLQESHRV
jgi:hypothetical protein